MASVPHSAKGFSFPATSWTLASGAGASDPALRKQHLKRLCQLYWRPVFWYLRRSRSTSEADAVDLTQSFFAWLLASNPLEKSDRGRERFRGFLRANLEEFLLGKHVVAPEERGAAGAPITIDDSDLALPNTGEGFDELFAASLLEDATGTLLAQLEAPGREKDKRAFEAHFLEDPRPSSAALAKELGCGETSVTHSIASQRDAFSALVRAKLSQTLHTPEDLEDELRHLFLGAFRDR
jgi:hypothetical protein